MSITVRLLDSMQDIEKNINTAIALYINGKLSNNSSNIIKDIMTHIPNWLRSQPELVSLLSKDSSSLAGYFGLINPSAAVDSIVESVTNSLTFKFVSYNNRLDKGGFEVFIQPQNFTNLLSLAEGHVSYVGGDLHWLDWLLTKGDTILVTNYHYNPSTGLGRSGLGNMIGGGSFRVPPQYSGTVDDNFVTRALSGSQQDKIITDIFEKYLG